MSDEYEDDGVTTTEAGASTSETPVKIRSKKDFITIENAIGTYFIHYQLARDDLARRCLTLPLHFD